MNSTVMQITRILLFCLLQTVHSCDFLFKTPIISNRRHIFAIHHTTAPIKVKLSPRQVPQNCYFVNRIVNCSIPYTRSNNNFGRDQSQLQYPVESQTESNIRLYRRSNNEEPQKRQNIIKQYSHTVTSIKKSEALNLKLKFQSPKGENKNIHRKQTVFGAFRKSLDNFDRKLYNITFNNLLKISPNDRKVNGISFVGSGLFLQLLLIALTDEVNLHTKAQIEKCNGLHLSKSEKLALLNKTVTQLPVSNNDIKFYWSHRLLLWPGYDVSQEFRKGAASAVKLRINKFNGSERPHQIVKILNEMIERDSGGAIRNTFVEDDVSDGVKAVLLTTMYLRARWRSAPTVLNGSRPFRDADDAPQRTIRMIRINDMMRYADITEWDAQALEIYYATHGLSILMLVPRSRSLQRLAATVTNVNDILRRMRTMRVAAILPLYTLRMTLLLPNKLEAMGITSLMNTTSNYTYKSLTISHAAQRIMFWAEAGRSAFKDDGIEWDEPPEFELVVDCPYMFFVRWKNMTLMHGNFVL